MNITKLGLIDFGKFSNCILDLKEGFNLIYGENESGKSTTFSFIDAMLYGFYKDSTKKRLTDDLFYKYKPWNSQSYKGFMELVYDNVNYRIERDLLNDTLVFLNLDTGEDLSRNANLYKFSKVAQPGAYIFNITRDIFKNTFYISQLESKVNLTDSSILIEELKNFVQSGDIKFNIHKAIEYLNSLMEDIGKKTKKNTKLGKLYQKFEEYNKEISNKESLASNYKELSFEVENLKEKLSSSNKLIEKCKLINNQKKYNKAYAKIVELNQLKSIKEDVVIDETSYEHILKLENKLLEISEKIETLNKEIKDNNSNYFEVDNSIIDDYEQFVSLENKLNQLNEINYSKEIKILNKNIEENSVKEKSYLIAGILSLISSIFIISISIKMKIYLLFFIIPFLMLYGYLRMKKYVVSSMVSKRLKIRIEDYQNLSINKTNEKKSMDIEFDILKNKYDTEDINELKTILQKLVDELKGNEIRNNFYKNETLKKENSIKELYNIKESLNNKLKLILEYYNLDSLDSAKKLFLSTIGKDSMKVKIDSLEELISQILDGDDLESLNSGIEVEDLDEESIINEHKVIELKLEKKKESLSNLENILSDLRTLREEREIILKEIIELDSKYKSIEKAKNTILNIESKKSSYIPYLIEKMGSYIFKITSKKYSKVLLDEEFNMSIYDESLNSYVNINDLSNGTIDQIYLAFRLSISNMLFNRACILLDDQFIQYDNFRMESTLEFLAKEFKNNQVIIFSATTREKEVLLNKNIEFNYIEMRNL